MPDTSVNHFIVVVSIFNCTHLIRRVVRSVQDQLYLSWTILFVDDYSIGDTKNVILDSAENNAKIQYRQMRKNSGVNAVRNRIIEEAKAIDNKAYLLFIDDDDYLAKNSLVLADKEISVHPEYNWFSLNCNYEGGVAISKIAQYGALSYLNDYMFGKKIRGDFTHILRLEALGAERFTSEFKNGEEWSFSVELSLTHTIYAIDVPGYIKEYLEGGLTETGINSDKAIKVLKFKIDTLEPIVGKKKMAHQYVSLAKNYLAKKYFIHAARALNEVLKSSPFYLGSIGTGLFFLTR
mgnify:CR=1 FL=1